MLKEVMHIGITVSNIENSIKFYRDKNFSFRDLF